MDNENSVLESALCTYHATLGGTGLLPNESFKKARSLTFCAKTGQLEVCLIQDCFKLGSSASYRPSFNAILPLPKRPPSVLLPSPSRVLRP